MYETVVVPLSFQIEYDFSYSKQTQINVNFIVPLVGTLKLLNKIIYRRTENEQKCTRANSDNEISITEETEKEQGYVYGICEYRVSLQ